MIVTMYRGASPEVLTMTGMSVMFCSLAEEWGDLDEFLWLRCGHVYRRPWTPDQREAMKRGFGYRPDWRDRTEIHDE